MEVELQEIHDFIARCAPFDRLPENVLEQLPKQLKQAYRRREQLIPGKQGTSGLYVLRKGSAELQNLQGQMIDKLAEGEWFIYQCHEGDHEQCIAIEDCLVLILPCDDLLQLQQQHPEFNQYFQHTLVQRLQEALESQTAIKLPMSSLLQDDVSHYLDTQWVGCTPQTSIKDAAQIMTQHNVSSIIVLSESAIVGLLTDSDIRKRVVATGLAIETQVAEVMTPEPVTIDVQQSAFAAALLMGRKGIQHLPVTDDEKIMGMLTARNLLRSESGHDLYLGNQIRQTANRQQLAKLCRKLPDLQRQIIEAGANAQQLGQLLAQITDALTQRLLQLAEQELGVAPVAYAWIACGSHARREQTMSSDQDNMLILANDFIVETHDHYFQQLSRFVSDGLHECGFQYCPGESMALNSHWRKSLSAWQASFGSWIEEPEPQSLRYASNFIDMRHIHGDKTLLPQLQQVILPQFKHSQIVLNKLASMAVVNQPPLGFFRNFVLIHSGEHEHQLDLKLGGILPVVDLARVYSLAIGDEAVNTQQRLQHAQQAGLISAELMQELLHAYDVITTLRARHQGSQIEQNEEVDNYMEPELLNNLQKRHLKDAFYTIKQAQDALLRQFAGAS